jgi:hypothetical protein
LISVDLPTPLDPSSAAVLAPSVALSSARPSPVTALTLCTGVPNAIISISVTRSASASSRSDFVNTIIGRAPDSHAIVR